MCHKVRVRPIKHPCIVFYKIVFIRMLEDNVVANVRTSDGDIDNFPINIGLHQGSTPSPFCFGDGCGHMKHTKWYLLVHALCG
jgi:hypothetical protein